MRVAFITEGGQELGMGHVIRTLTLAREIETTCEILFITSSQQAVVSTIERNHHRVLVSSDFDDSVTKLVEFQPVSIVIDYPTIEEETTRLLRESLDSRIVLFDSNSEANRNADVVVNPLIDGDFRNTTVKDKGIVYLKGPRYLPLRKEFFEDHSVFEKAVETTTKILLVFGGSDPSNLTSKYLKRIMDDERWTKITVIVGPAYGHNLEEIRDELVCRDSRIDFHQNPEDIVSLMKDCELMLTSPGLTVFEGLLLGKHVIAIPQNNLQRTVYHTLLEQHNKIPELLDVDDDDAFYLSPTERIVKDMEIGKGREEVIAAITKIP